VIWDPKNESDGRQLAFMPSIVSCVEFVHPRCSFKIQTDDVHIASTLPAVSWILRKTQSYHALGNTKPDAGTPGDRQLGLKESAFMATWLYTMDHQSAIQNGADVSLAE
jgi:hypothetical protein